MANTENEYPLRFSWTVSIVEAPKAMRYQRSEDEWMSNVHLLSTIRTLKQFWQVCHHIPKPSILPAKTVYYIFKEGIKPAWEYGDNVGGGKIIISLKTSLMKAAGEKMYFDLLLLIIGNQLSSADDVCGMIFKRHKDEIEIWIKKTANNRAMKASIIAILNEILTLKSELFRLSESDVTYRPHEHS
ncbi:Translation initiation factor 4E [Monocercomonoides exilis]|uniref:Translation initiation factor 4E n=1 Tax=Monocercomonoides exilis TaxID=2049356 RepID=UPI00355AC284|nr:Translation initiation factor 4E [Monocercomonoides exilis]|eukprot:MONOS_5953.1-p1 / transcript=MONOS_5953.1 / gene=MONOS_5953 / organism=Monocercomonoides_exilis_PA203 / gene_product=Translation initiation factor 4E / transcript_product=Translation initiation factor 4E / location=Mono_scaffold00180:41621-42245(+) / protein_length=186 / sequence_SO=supercontig / SO=protein_coding / is_pseudo=false